MKVLLLGATGPTGGHVLAHALEAGDAVSVLARRPEALTALKDRITIFQGDATSVDDVARAAEGQDAVIAALGRGSSLRPEGLFTGSARAVVEAMTRAGVKRLV
jgi:putative nucleoside-diphosphate-sugar epimerase